MIKLTKRESLILGVGWVMFVIGAIGIVASGPPVQPTTKEPIFTYFLFLGLAGLAFISVGSLIRNSRAKKPEGSPTIKS